MHSLFNSDDWLAQHQGLCLFLIGLLCVLGAIWSMMHAKPWQATIAFIGLAIASIINALRNNGKPAREHK